MRKVRPGSERTYLRQFLGIPLAVLEPGFDSLLLSLSFNWSIPIFKTLSVNRERTGKLHTRVSWIMG